MSGKRVYMRLSKEMVDQLLLIDHEYYIQFVCDDGTMVVWLLQALYGCIDSGKLWYELFKDFAVSQGYLPNSCEPCVFNKVINGNQVTFALHVDDLLITSVDEKAIDLTIGLFRDRFKEMSVKDGPVVPYTGMSMDFTNEGEVKISMKHCVEEIIRFYEVKGKASTPASSELFSIDENSSQLTSEDRIKFHSTVAKLLYLAKRTRPDVLLATNFLTTRVKNPTLEDSDKLDRVMRYLNSTVDLGIVLRPDPSPISIVAHVDASFGTHPDGKGHTGMCIALGRGPVYIKSSKQRIVCKSSTESELVALSDSSSQVIWCRDFLESQGYSMGPAVIYQDNMSTMRLAEKGRSTSERTRHISIRYFFIKDRVDAKEIIIKHLGTEDMTSDMLTKPLQGSLFLKMRDKLLNWRM
jgi:hypothetical protein